MLPKAVEEANRRAEDLHRQIYGNTEQPPQGTPEAKPAPGKEEPPNQTPPTEAAVEPRPEPKAQDDEASWKRRYEVLNGKYQAEIPRMAAEIRDLKGRLVQAEARAAAPAQPAPKLSQEDREEYGDLIDVMKRAAAEVVPQDVNEIKQSVEQLRGETTRLAKDRFFSDLTRIAPQWESLNENKDFLAWLSGFDLASGRLRSELFDDAVSRFDAMRVAHFFSAYGGTKEPEPQVPDPLEQQVEPPAQRRSAPTPGKKMWRTSEIASFYAGVRAGQYNREDADRIERDIFAAQSEGRIVSR
jgi:hypothetical protein